MGVDYIVRLIENRENLPDVAKKFLNSVDKEETTINGKKYYLTMDWNGESSNLSGDEYEKFDDFFNEELMNQNAAYGNFG